MSTYLGEAKVTRIESEQDLWDYFGPFAKLREAIRVGIEAEFFGIDRKTGLALPFQGERGIESVLRLLSELFGYEQVHEGGNIIALKKGSNFVTLEPGGQVELSAAPVGNVFEVEAQIKSFVDELRAVRSRLRGIEWLATGIQPFDRVANIHAIPKKRYEIMAEYLGGKGTLSHEMMKCTASNQVNVDYLSEENAMANLKTVVGISSIATAMFANSSVSEGRPNGFLTRRLHIWNHTDPDRSGLLLDFTEEGKSFRDYLEYLFKMPMMFIIRQGEWIPVRNLTFRNFIRDGYQGTRATFDDFQLHLSGAFPEVRLKQYLEIRGIDGQSPDLIPAAAAFWKGILYNCKASEKAWNLVSFASREDRMRLHQEVPVKGLKANLGGRPIFPIAQELVEISCASLAQQKTRDETRDECVFLSRIRENIIKPQKTPAETLLETWKAKKYNPSELIEYLSIG